MSQELQHMSSFAHSFAADAELETQKISHVFGSLVSKIQQCLERGDVTVDAFIEQLMEIRGVDTMLMYSQRSLFHAAMEQVQAQKSIEDIFPCISGYFSWFNHTPIEKMVEAFCHGDDEVRSTYRSFKLLFEDFCVNMVSACHKHGFGFERKKDAAKLVVKFDLMETVAKVNELVAIRNIVALHIKVKKQSLYLSSASCNITTMATFLVPLFVAEAAFPLTTDQENALSQCGVLQMECGNYRYSSPAWSQERESTESRMGLTDSMWYMSMMTVGAAMQCHQTNWPPVPFIPAKCWLEKWNSVPSSTNIIHMYICLK